MVSVVVASRLLLNSKASLPKSVTLNIAEGSCNKMLHHTHYDQQQQCSVIDGDVVRGDSNMVGRAPTYTLRC